MNLFNFFIPREEKTDMKNDDPDIAATERKLKKQINIKEIAK